MKRVLLAEDEAIIGMMMREFLLEYGLFVVGPCCTASEALAASSGSDFDCAILDLNLGGESVYPVATALAERKVPFAFVTGYGRESLDGRFADVPILQKPITRENLESCLRDMLNMPSSHAGEGSQPLDNTRAPPSAMRA
jgi:CheY-like chemotaxis protein